jgi:hypothetical protein
MDEGANAAGWTLRISIFNRWALEAAKETVFNPYGGLNSVITVSPDNENSTN